MAAKFLEVAVILTAMDRMSSTVNRALGGAQKGYESLMNAKERADRSLMDGVKFGAAAEAGVAVLDHFADKFGEAQEAQLDLASSMMGPGGILNSELMGRINQFAVEMSGKYAGAQKDYIEMVRIMKQNRINPEDVLGGIGEPVAQLAELFKMPPGQIGLFASRMKNDMRIATKDMGEMTDMLTRLQNVGVGTNGPEAVMEMTDFFSKAGLGASNLGMTGVQNAKDLGALGGMFIAKGLSGGTTGTAFRRIFDNMADPKKFAKMNEEAAKLGIHLQMFDKQKNFLGVPNMVAQIGLLKKFTIDQQAMVLDPFGGKQGLGLDFTKQLARFGPEDFNRIIDGMRNQATQAQKTAKQQEGYNQQMKIMHANLDNLQAAIGKSYTPGASILHSISEFIGDASKFFNDHQKITAAAAAITAVGISILGIASAISIVKAAMLYSGMASGFTSVAAMLGAPALWEIITTGIANAGIALAVFAPEVVAIAAAMGIIYGLSGGFNDKGRGGRMSNSTVLRDRLDEKYGVSSQERDKLTKSVNEIQINYQMELDAKHEKTSLLKKLAEDNGKTFKKQLQDSLDSDRRRDFVHKPALGLDY